MARPVPGKAELALLEPFVGLPLERIQVPASEAEFAAAAAAILAEGIVGFDTESKPTFAVGEVSEGPHVVQFALPEHAYLFQLHHAVCHPFLRELLQAEQLLKVGFDLKSDSAHIRARLGVGLNGVVDLNTVFSQQGYPRHLGVRTAVGLVFGRRFAKSRKITTSNWAQPQLTPQQMLYAANDAWAALRVLQALALPREALPIMGSSAGLYGTMPDVAQQ